MWVESDFTVPDKEKPDGPLLSVVIANWNGWPVLKSCLLSLGRQARPIDEIIVVDNGSSDQSVRLIQEYFPTVRVIQLSGNTGFCVANNIGAQAASGGWLIFLNNDTEVPREFTEQLGAALEGCDSDLIAVRMLQMNARERIDNCGLGYAVFGAGRQRFHGAVATDPRAMVTRRTLGPSGACLVIRRRTFEAIGGFDEALFFNNEDVDLGLRARAMGYTCTYIPRVVVYHVGSASAVCVARRTYYYIQRNMEIVFWKNFSGAAISVMTVPHLCYVLLQFARAIRSGNVRLFVRAKWDAVRLCRTCEDWRKGRDGSDRTVIRVNALTSLIAGG